MRSVYELKKFRNSKHPDLIDALKLYTENTEPAFRTDTKEIMHCLDNWNQDFDDPFFVVGFYFNNVLIGFSELAYFKQEKFVIVDYVVISKGFRGTHTFFQFLHDIKQFLNDESIEYNYIVAEVGCYNEGLEPPESSKFLIRLLKISHFGVVKCNYYVPRVGIFDYESQMRAIMMVNSANESKQIRKETFFQIVNAIYFKYYQRWHNIFVDEKEKAQYNKELNFLIEKMRKQLEKKEVIEINGLTGLFPLSLDSHSEVNSKKFLKIITYIALFVLSFALISGIYVMFKHLFGWDSTTVSTIFTGALGLAIVAGAMLFENKSGVFSKLLEKIILK